MQSSIQRMVSDGTLQFIDLAIEYIDKVNVKVSVDDVPIGAPGSGTPYTYEWITDTRIKITPEVPLAGIVVLRRVTPTLKMYHVYDDGATFNDFTMDENFKQLLFIGQEAIDGGVATDFYSDINMHLYRIKNIGDAVDPRDAIPLAQYQADALGAYNNRVASAASASAALASQNSATSSANNAAISASTASNSATTATTQASTSTTQAGIATTKASEASTSAAAAAASLDSFDDRYLGPKTSNPTLDNDGSALLEGALYWNTVAKEMRVYSGTAWLVAYLPATGYLEKNQNLADLVNASTARSNLGLGTAATVMLTTSNTDVTVGRVTKVGDFGLGAINAPAITNANLPVGTGSGIYALYTPFTNAPAATPVIIIHQSYSGAMAQTAIEQGTSNNRMWIRQYNGSAWLPWAEVWTTENLVKTASPIDTTVGRMLKVGDFGLGIPTGIVNTDSLVTSGMFQCAAGTGTLPAGFTNGTVLNLVRNVSPARLSQILQDDSSGRMWVRGSGGDDTLDAWVEVATSANSFGQGQTWQPVTRASGTTYTNSTGKAIVWSMSQAASTTLTITIAGTVVWAVTSGGSDSSNVSFIIPAGATYSYTGAITQVFELR